VQAAAFAEAIALVNQSALDPEKAIAVFSGSALASPLIKRMMAAMAADDFTPNFSLKLMTKDIGYAMHEGESRGVALQTAASALEIFRRAVAQGMGDHDFSAVVKAGRAN